VTRSKLEYLELPSVKEVNSKRIANFKQQITDTIANTDIKFFEGLITEYQEETQVSATVIAASLAKLLHTENNFLLSQAQQKNAAAGQDSYNKKMAANLETYRIEVGKEHGIQVGDILHVIESIANIDRQYIGQITLRSQFSLIDLPGGMTKDVFQLLKKAEICDKKLKITKLEGASNTHHKRNKPKSRSDFSSNKKSAPKKKDFKNKKEFKRKREKAATY
jgi:ATP-dependent RNA helicase DeaD